MAYGIYLLKYINNNSQLPGPDGLWHDASFTSDAKETMDVINDAVLHVIANFRREQEYRSLSDLDSTYTYEKLGMSGLPGESAHIDRINNIHIHATLEHIPDLLRTLQVEILHTFDQVQCDLIDEAIEIIKDCDVTIALRPYIRPALSPVALSLAISRVRAGKEQLLSSSAFYCLETRTEALREAVDDYVKLMLPPAEEVKGE